MNKLYFGQGCNYFIGQWEEHYIESIPIEECEMKYKPILVFCNHEDNPDNHEGNCNEKLCPLLRR